MGKNLINITEDEKKTILGKYSVISEEDKPLQRCTIFDLKNVKDAYDSGQPLSIDINSLSDKELMVIKSPSLKYKMCLANKADIMNRLV